MAPDTNMPQGHPNAPSPHNPSITNARHQALQWQYLENEKKKRAQIQTNKRRPGDLVGSRRGTGRVRRLVLIGLAVFLLLLYLGERA